MPKPRAGIKSGGPAARAAAAAGGATGSSKKAAKKSKDKKAAAKRGGGSGASAAELIERAQQALAYDDYDGALEVGTGVAKVWLGFGGLRTGKCRGVAAAGVPLGSGGFVQEVLLSAGRHATYGYARKPLLCRSLHVQSSARRVRRARPHSRPRRCCARRASKSPAAWRRWMLTGLC